MLHLKGFWYPWYPMWMVYMMAFLKAIPQIRQVVLSSHSEWMFGEFAVWPPILLMAMSPGMAGASVVVTSSSPSVLSCSTRVILYALPLRLFLVGCEFVEDSAGEEEWLRGLLPESISLLELPWLAPPTPPTGSLLRSSTAGSCFSCIPDILLLKMSCLARLLGGRGASALGGDIGEAEENLASSSDVEGGV